MTRLQPGDLVLIAFPLASGGPGKQRPALVVADTGDSDLIVARVTTQPHRSSFDLEIAEWQAAGLRAQSWVRLHKLATLEKALVSRKLGTITSADRTGVALILSRLWNAW
jgi:mRNA interferase MazF